MRKNLWLVALCLLTLSQSYAQRTIYVSSSGTNNPPYLNWPDAATNIQDAINVATNGEVVQLSNDVYVSTGIYSSNSFLFITNGITLRGFSAQSPTNTVIDGGNPAFTNGCIYMDNANARLEQIWVRNGYTTVSNPAFTAGGVYVQNGTISNCWVTGCSNLMTGAGGVVLNNGIITHSVISNNVNAHNLLWAENAYIMQGGGIFMSGSARVYNSDIISNKCTTCVCGGAGVTASGAIFSNCNFRYNYNPTRGGAMQIGGSGGVTIYNCEFFRNGSGGIGGAIACGSPDIRYSSFVSNYNNSWGGALIVGNPGFTIQNCLFYGNTGNQGGGLFLQNVANCANSKVESCTFVGNSATASGGGLYFGISTNNLILNCIIAFNSATTVNCGDVDVPTYTFDASLSNKFHYCGINSNLSRAVYLVTNNPQLVNMAGGDCRLNAGSPCLNAGSNQSWMVNAKDLVGNPRIDYLNNAVDIGAYEFHFSGLMFKGRP